MPELHIDKVSCEVRSDETQAAKRRLPVVKFSGVHREAGSGNMVEKGFCPRLLRQEMNNGVRATHEMNNGVRATH